jgi:hypothetical protein
MWLKIFKDKNLEIWNNDIKNVNDYIKEYNTMSYAKHTCNNLFQADECYFHQFQIILKDKDINMNHDINIRMLDIFPVIVNDANNVQNISFTFRFEHNKKEFLMNLLFRETTHNTIFYKNYVTPENLYIILLKLLYYYHNLNITDSRGNPIIMDKRAENFYNEYYKGFCENKEDGDDENNDVIISRKLYWDECYKSYQETYF